MYRIIFKNVKLCFSRIHNMTLRTAQALYTRASLRQPHTTPTTTHWDSISMTGMFSAPIAVTLHFTCTWTDFYQSKELFTGEMWWVLIKGHSGTPYWALVMYASTSRKWYALGNADLSFFFLFYRYGTVDFNGTARRKNATRETTSTLKTWLYEHRKNPYPTKGEKIMLAIITKMTLTQVSTWFANARRRLKKENKMTWSPKNKAGEDRKDDLKSDQDCAIKGKHLSTVDGQKLAFSITWK